MLFKKSLTYLHYSCFCICLVALAILGNLNELKIALPSLPAFVAVLAPATGAAPPNVTAVNPANNSSSTAIEPIIPKYNQSLILHYS
ncbi:MAG: hypothetical protein CM15mV42_1000 [uncultured marine virus]|nr:MAG: hypothetical protein CM15mV42_1000 [uncultured marine virus]